jgi:hypothetical protein
MMKQVIAVATLALALACQQPAPDAHKAAEELKQDTKAVGEKVKQSEAAQRIAKGAKEAAQGVKQGTGEVIESAGDKLKKAGEKVKESAKKNQP